MLTLYEHSEKRLVDTLIFQAKLHGIDVKTPPTQAKKDGNKGSSEGKCISGDPDSYSHLSMEEREDLTRRMMNGHKIWAQEKTPLPTAIPPVRKE